MPDRPDNPGLEPAAVAPRGLCLGRRAALLVAVVLATPATGQGPCAYVTNYADNTVSVIDTALGAVVAMGESLDHCCLYLGFDDDCPRRDILPFGDPGGRRQGILCLGDRGR